MIGHVLLSVVGIAAAVLLVRELKEDNTVFQFTVAGYAVIMAIGAVWLVFQ